MTLKELVEKIERIQELQNIAPHRLTDDEIYELSSLEDIQLKEQNWEE